MPAVGPIFATRSSWFWARIGHGSGVINFSTPDSRPMKSRLTRHFGSSRADDHEMRTTSLVILVLWVFE
jgi:hypothetical protein